jgi:hypothetical protein
MALSPGTTSRQFSAVSGWLVTVGFSVGMAAWWWPSYQSWGATAGLMILLLAMYMAVKISAGDGTVPGNPVYFPALISVALASCHFAAGLKDETASLLDNMMNVSAIYHIGLFALGVLLVQALAAGAPLARALRFISGAAMIAGGLLSHIIVGQSPAAQAMTPVAVAGAGLCLATASEFFDHAALTARTSITGAAIAALATLSTIGPHVLLFGSATAGAIILLTSILSRGHRLVGVPVGVLCAGVSAWRLARAPGLIPPDLSAFGSGESAFDAFTGADSGLHIISSALGWMGLGIIALAALAAACWIVIASARQKRTSRIIMTCAAAFAASAFLAPGGLFLPSCTLAAATCWAFSAADIRPPRAYGSAAVAVSLGALTLLLGVVSQMGLAIASARAFHLDDGFLHATAGFLSTLAICWVMGVRRFWLGLVAIVVGAALGGVGEWLQSLGNRSPEMRDWANHIFGSALAGLTFILGRGCGLCESHESRHNEKPPAAYEQFPGAQ